MQLLERGGPNNSSLIMSHSIPAAPSHLPPPLPGLLRGSCPPFQSRGWGICKFCAARGPGICQPRGQPRAFDTHAVSYQNITTQRVLLEKKQIGSSVKDRNKLKRVVKACSRFYACISSLLIKPELHSETWELSTWINVFWLVNQIFVDINWRTSFHIYNLFITYDLTALWLFLKIAKNYITKIGTYSARGLNKLGLRRPVGIFRGPRDSITKVSGQFALS